ncbi:MAG: hypothetical protein SWZ49_21065 [Cyanobacteriota bacterium]|nr:hypothetical protein [Cyanobacteriota bacterium]
MSKTKADDLCQVRCFNTELVTQIRETFPSEDTGAGQLCQNKRTK